ncbi:MAG: hypothetical protein A2021_09175 [Elusimicrobia bacterium GWF2_52_66]|nr:MAG: hypothetical protein A2X33_00480 [Elusimicrobia bacterium GWA2_51_34]OGR87615.1 MAG: hypothetical protein A2021_09175 [Elusimicrobia bacterium GWF2_52_66]HAF96346.1 hypothetical protein [Elusimicrobiota bacterium]HCE98532.1 hypothetical protein [Elusimicrobiota bacterium]
MKITGILAAALLTAAFMVLGKIRSQDFYLAALVSGFVFFRLATGSSCPLAWLLSKLGAKGLSCPSDGKMN